MCLLTFLPAGVLPDLDALHRGATRNPHGHGLAILVPAHPDRSSRAGRGGRGGRLIVRRGLNPDRLIEAMDQLRHRHLDGPALFHSRLATSGRHDLANCHPFPVDHDRRTVLAHNGILPAALQPRRGDLRSDTRIAAEEFTARFGPAHSVRVQRKLERWMSPFNKMVVLSVDPAFTRPAVVLNEKAGTWQHGIWYSNGDHEPDRPRDQLRGWESGPGASGGDSRCRDCAEPLASLPGQTDRPDSRGCGWCWTWTCHRCGLVLDDWRC